MERNLASALRRARRERELTQAEAAKLIGTSQQNLANWETGSVPRPSPDSRTYRKTLKQLSDFLNIGVGEVLRLAYAPWSDSEGELAAYERRIDELHERLAELRPNNS